MTTDKSADFSKPPTQHEFEAFLFDMDGTIIDSTAAVVLYWHQIGREIGVDGDHILQTSHGRRSIDILQELKPELANWEYIAMREGEIPLKYGSDAAEIPGSRTLLEQLTSHNVPWSIVTSGTKPLVSGWLKRMALPAPDTMVTAEDVANGKPDPACYVEGAKRLAKQHDRTWTSPDRVLVLEDAPAGIRAGKAAGFKVLAVATTHPVESLRQAGADWIVRDPRSVSLSSWSVAKGIATLEIRDALR